MKKISTLLALVMVMALAVPALAADGNVKITGSSTTTFDDFSEVNDGSLKDAWRDGNVLDDDDFEFGDDFNQELSFDILAETDAATVDVALNANTKEFTKEEDYGTLVLDDALVTVKGELVTVKAGDLDDYGITNYFVDEVSLDGVEASTTAMGVTVTGLRAQDEGITYKMGKAATTVANVDLTGRVLTKSDNEDAQTYTLEAKTTVSPFTVTGEVARNEGNLMRLGVEAPLAVGGTATADFEQVGKDFVVVKEDGVSADTTEYSVGVKNVSVGAATLDVAEVTYEEEATVEVGATYAVVPKLVSINGEYTLETAKDVKDVVEAGATLTPTKATEANFSYEQALEAENNDNTYTTITLDGSYDVTDALALTAKVVNESDEKDTAYESYTYYEAGVDYKVAKDVTLDTTVARMSDKDDNTSNRIKTELTVDF